jgi:rhodanese-related sulfurtransferase
MITPTRGTTVAALVAAAKGRVANLTPVQVADEMAGGAALLVDLRETEERRGGTIPGATHAPRGMLEFYADPASPYHRPEFARDRRIILHCASGGRSALGAVALQGLGYTNVAHLDGGLTAWREAGQPIEPARAES